MKLRSVVLACAALCTANAMAFNCSVVVTPITTVYSPSAPDNISTGSYNVTCTRLAADPATLDFSLAANSGAQPSGAQNRVAVVLNTAPYITYELYRSASISNGNRWQLSGTSGLYLRFNGTLSFGAVGSVASSGSLPFTLLVGTGQTGRPSGIYTDTVSVFLRDRLLPISTMTYLANPSFGVTVITQPSCQISTPPGTVNFSYTSFQVTASTATTNFDANCTSALPYVVTVSAPTGPLLGLAYTLSVSSSSVLQTKSVMGSGSPQNHIIYGSIPANQSGTCATATCTDTAPQTITISY